MRPAELLCCANRVIQRRDAPDHTWYIGKGKVEELKEVCLAVDADTVVFDNELAPAQQFNLEKLLGRTAIDRTAVILDIFGQNAHTLEGKAQVELALLRYRLPRLRRGKSANLDQQRGGVGARFGGGETKIETAVRKAFLDLRKDPEPACLIAHGVTKRVRTGDQAFIHPLNLEGSDPDRSAVITGGYVGTLPANTRVQGDDPCFVSSP